MGVEADGVAFSAEIQQELDALLLPWEDVSPRKMFGAMVYLAKGKMFAFVYDNRVVVKVPEEQKSEAEKRMGAGPFIHGHTGKFGDWMELPLAGVREVGKALPWIRNSYDQAQNAPPARSGNKKWSKETAPLILRPGWRSL